MCLIAHRPVKVKGTGKRRRVRGANIPNATAEYARRHNADGFGIAWRNSSKDGKLWYAKYGPKAWQEFETRLKEVDADTTQEYVAHWRFRTHGPACEALSHPFRYEDPIEGTVLVFHNGIISPVRPTSTESDTEVFVRDILAKLPSAWWRNEGILAILDDYIGWSRITLMTQSETVTIGAENGTWDGGLWYSSSYKEYVSPASVNDWTNYRSSEMYIPNTAYASSGAGVHPTTIQDTANFSNEWGEMKDNKWHPSARAKLIDEYDDDEWDGITVAGAHIQHNPKPLWETPVVGNKDGNWYHAGHVIIPLEADRSEGFHEEKALCDVCHTVGNFYVMGKSVHVEIAHVAALLDLVQDQRLVPLIGDTNLG